MSEIKISVGSESSGPTKIDLFDPISRSESRDFEGVVRTNVLLRYRVSGAAPATQDRSEFNNEITDERLDASYLVKLGSDDTDLGLLTKCVEKAASRLLDCAEQLKLGSHLEADDIFMSTKEVVAEIFMLRSISEAVGLVSMSALKALSTSQAIVDTPELPGIIRKALNRLTAAPFMDFGSACILSDEIEAASKCSSLPGYNELAAELISDAAAGHG